MQSIIISRDYHELVSYEEISLHTRVLDPTEGPLIDIYRDAAIDAAERYTNRLFSPAEVTATFDEYHRIFYLPFGDVSSVKEIKAVSLEGEVITITDFHLNDNGGVTLSESISYCDYINFSFTYTVGYAAGKLPPLIKNAILMMIGTLYNVREDISYGVSAFEVPQTHKRLLEPFVIRQGFLQ